MNLRVDIILESEQRPAGVLSLKFVIRTVSIVVPALIAVFVASAILKVVNMGTKERRLAATLKTLEEQVKTYDKVSGQLKTNYQILDTLQGWKNSRANWNRIFQVFQKETPEVIQLMRLRMPQEPLLFGNSPGRKYSLVIEGRIGGKESDPDKQKRVLGFSNRLIASPLMTPWLTPNGIKATYYGPPRAAGAQEGDMEFDLTCDFKPRTFK